MKNLNIKLFLISFLSFYFALFSLIRITQARIIHSRLPLKISLLNNYTNTTNNNCKPVSGSILKKANDSKNKTLIIIIDAYPINSVFQEITKSKSVLHDYLIENSNSYFEGKTISSSSPYSISYLLGGITPNEKCTYPSFANKFNINLIQASEQFSQEHSLCREFLGFNFKSNILRFKEKFNRVKEKKLFKKVNNKCHLGDNIFDANAANLIRREIEKNTENNIFIMHDMLWHGRSRDNNFLKIVDSRYLKGLKFYLDNLLNTGEIDHLILMSDHGIRRNFKRDNFINKEKTIEINSKLDENLFSFFITNFYSKESKKMDNYQFDLPKTKSRFIVDKYSIPYQLETK